MSGALNEQLDLDELLEGGMPAAKSQNGRCYEDRYEPCMIMGASMAATAVANSVVTYHGPGGCRMTLEHLRSDNIPNGLYTMILSSGLDQGDVIHGGSHKLYRLLNETTAYMAERLKGVKIVWLLTACAASIIGDDIVTAAKDAEKRTGLKVIPLDTPGFFGGFTKGFESVYCALVDNFAQPEGKIKDGNTINLLGPQLLGSKNWSWDYAEMIRLMEAAGIKINLVMTHKTDVDDVRDHYFKAAANYVLSPEAMTNFESQSQGNGMEIFGRDLVQPIGLANTEEWYLKIAERFGDLKKAKKQLNEDMKMVKNRLRMDYNASWVLHDASGKHCAVLGYAAHAAAVARYCLYDLNLRPVLIGLYGETPQAIKTARKQLVELENFLHPKIMENPTYHEWGVSLRDSAADFAIGMKQDRALAEGVGVPHLSLGGFYFLNQFNFVPWPYYGIRGSLSLLSEIARVLDAVKQEKQSWTGLSFIKPRQDT